MNKDELDGCTALVLGATSCLGRATAVSLAARGAHVVVVDRERKALASAFGGDRRFTIREIGVDDHDRVRAAADQFREIDVLVHSPSASFRPRAAVPAKAKTDGSADRESAECWQAIRPFVPAMVERGRGSIIVFSPWRPAPVMHGQGFQTAAQSPISELVKHLAAELGPHGVRINTIVPGSDAIAGALAFFASERSSHLTGSVLAVDGDWSVIGSLSAAPL